MMATIVPKMIIVTPMASVLVTILRWVRHVIVGARIANAMDREVARKMTSPQEINPNR